MIIVIECMEVEWNKFYLKNNLSLLDKSAIWWSIATLQDHITEGNQGLIAAISSRLPIAKRYGWFLTYVHYCQIKYEDCGLWDQVMQPGDYFIPSTYQDTSIVLACYPIWNISRFFHNMCFPPDAVWFQLLPINQTHLWPARWKFLSFWYIAFNIAMNWILLLFIFVQTDCLYSVENKNYYYWERRLNFYIPLVKIWLSGSREVSDLLFTLTMESGLLTR